MFEEALGSTVTARTAKRSCRRIALHELVSIQDNAEKTYRV
jgi:hypothetical protein